MNVRWAAAVAVVGIAYLAPASASAQQLSASALSDYRAMSAALQKAVAVRAQSSTGSLNQLQAAQSAFDRWQDQLGSSAQARNLSNALADTRAALARSPADLAAQVTQARGLMRAALYTQTLALLSGQSAVAPSARQQVSVLAQEFGWSAAEASQLAQQLSPASVPTLQRQLERAAASKVQQYLGAVNFARRPEAYINLASAASWFTPVQDAPEAGDLTLAQFAGALGQVAANNPAAPSSVAALKRNAAAFARALRQPLGAAAPSSAAKPLQLPSTSGQAAAGSAASKGAGQSASSSSSARPAPSAPSNHAGLGLPQSPWQVGLALLLAACSVYPLRLLNLAFGQRNPYWRAILGGMALLLAPLWVMGIGGALALLGRQLHLSALSQLATLNPAVVWPVWLLGAALSLAALTYGFRGLCVQFGLLGKRAAPVEVPSSLNWEDEA